MTDQEKIDAILKHWNDTHSPEQYAISVEFSPSKTVSHPDTGIFTTLSTIQFNYEKPYQGREGVIYPYEYACFDRQTLIERVYASTLKPIWSS